MGLDTWAGKYIRTFSLLDKSARIDITPAYQKATWTELRLWWEKRGNGVDKDDKQNLAWKLSFAYPLNRAAGIKLSSIETRTRETTGFDSETLTAGISFAW